MGTAMTPLGFLRTVWPANGFYCIATPLTKGFKHATFDTIEAAAAYAEKVADKENVFFATHALKEVQVWNPKHHKDKTTGEYVGSWSVRTQANMRASRIVFLDLDVKPNELETAYGTQLEAGVAIVNFVREAGLPRPMIVSSGGGLHIYWVFDREMDSATEWLTQASRLKQLATLWGLKFDPSRTTDSASVLRVAGTFNHKKGLKRPVEAKNPPQLIGVEQWDDALTLALGKHNVAPSPEVHAAASELGNNTKKEWDRPPPAFVEVLKVCKQMQRLARLKGCNSEPEWY